MKFWDEINHQFKEKLPFVVYRKPHQKHLNCLIQNDNRTLLVQNFKESGFVFAPFDDNRSAILIRPDKKHQVDYNYIDKSESYKNILQEVDLHQKEFHVQLVKKGINEITTGKLKKVVLSRKIEYPISAQPISLFKRLLDSYFSAFCYLWYHPNIGIWIGASPELLLQSNNGDFATMSLAGTQKYNPAERPNWKDKESEEQAMVTTYITESLENSVDRLSVSTLESVRAGALWHLRTSISGKMRNYNLAGLIKKLHPTPAVCGIPKDSAKAFILKNEQYDREYYTGFLGELNFGGDNNISSELYVNLRCMQIKNKLATVYVGGGITLESIPENEWQETVDKSQTIFKILLNSN